MSSAMRCPSIAHVARSWFPLYSIGPGYANQNAALELGFVRFLAVVPPPPVDRQTNPGALDACSLLLADLTSWTSPIY